MADLKTQFGFTDSLFAAINEVRASATSVVGADDKLKEDVDTADFKIGKDGRKVRAHRVVTTNKAKEVEEESHQSKTTMKHINNPNAAEKKAAKDIKPGIKGVKDRLDMLKAAKNRGALKEEGIEELDELSTKTLAKAAKSASDPDSDYHYGKSHDPQKFADHAKKTKDAKSAAAVQGAADAKSHYPRDNHTQGHDKLADRTPSRVTASGKANKQDTKALKTKLKEEEIDEGSGSKEKQTSKYVDRNSPESKAKIQAARDRMVADKKAEAGKALLSKLKKEELEESFSSSQISALKAEYSKINGIDPSSDNYKKLIAMLDKLDLASLKSLAGADIKFVSGLAKNRVMRKSVKEETKVEEELKGDQHKLDKNKNGKLDAEDFKKVRKEDVEIEEGTGNLKPGWMLKKDSELAKKVKEKQDLAKKREASHGDKSAGKSVAEGIIAKIKAVKRGMDAKAKAADHFDKAGDPTNPNKSKDLKRAVKYHNLVNKEETEIEEEVKGEYERKVDKYLKKKYAPDDSKKKQPQGADFAAARRKERMDKNGRMDEEVKVGDKVSFDHPMKAIPGKTMKKVGTVHKVEDDTVHIKVKDKYGVITHKKSASELTKEEFESIDEAPKYDNKYTIYHKDYSSAVQHAAVHAGKQGYEIDHDDWDRVVAMGPKKPSAGKTNILNVSLKKDGKESKKKLHMQVYNMDNKGYELNTYVEEVQLDELNKDTVYSYAKKSEKDQDDQYNKIGKGIRDKDPKAANAAGHKFSMRSIGQNRAEKRLSKEEVSVNEAAKQPTKKFKDMKKKNTAGTKSEEGTSKKGEPLSGKKEPIEVNPDLHKTPK